MIKSLTGFGSVEVSDKSIQLTVLIKSINSRFLDTKFRGIDIDPQLEMDIRKEIQNTLVRGSVTVQIFYKNGMKIKDPIKFDRERYKQIDKMISTIQKEFGKRLDIGDLVNINDLVVGKDSSDLDKTIILRGIKEALKQLDKMRQIEGKAINDDITKRINNIQTSLNNIENKSSEYVKKLNENYRENIKSLIDDIKVDNDRLAQEIAITVDKYDFTEEVVRGISHCGQFLQYLRVKEPVGKRLNFLLQELTREVNTIGSKSPMSDISNVVVELKSEIERIREQIQNIL
jgi:uncharacterized protein (TIGR00255 family)